MSEHLDRLARVYGGADEVRERLSESTDPVGPDYLHEVAGSYLRAGDRLLDAGCRNAGHLVRLMKSNDVTAIGIDPLAVHIERAEAAVLAADLAERATILQGVAQSVPFPDAFFDFIWCRDVLGVIDQLPEALAEMRRVLNPDGHLLVYTVFSTELLEPRETDLVHLPMGNVPANYDRARVERLFAEAGLSIERQEEIGTQWREYEEERSQPASDALLRLARLRHRKSQIVEEFGQEEFDVEQASLHWLVYMFIGKLTPVMYVLRRAPRV